MKLTILKDARKFIRRLPQKHQQRIVTAIFALPKGDVAPLEGEKSAYRLRVGDWRVVYQVIGDEIIIRKVGNRGDVYK